MKVLVVDDSRTMLLMMRRHLQDFGFKEEEIYTSDRGREALDILGVTNISLVLLDWHIPDLGGIDMLKLIKKLPDRKIPVIMVTTEQKQRCIQQAITIGVDDYLIKPIETKRLAEKISRVAKKYRLELPKAPEKNQSQDVPEAGLDFLI